MLNSIFAMFSYSFLIRAVIVGILVSLCASLLGVSLVLKRFSMIGDGLSHVGFGALAIAGALNLAPLAVAIPVVIIATFFLLKLKETNKDGDSMVAIISTSSLAIGITVVSFSTGMTTDINNYMFGSILSLSKGDVILSIPLTISVIVLFILFYNRIFSITFDERFAKATGQNVEILNTLIAVLTAVTIVLGMRLMGALLISALIIFPALTSMKLFKSFLSVTISSAVVSVLSVLIGMVLSYNSNTPTGAGIVLVNLAIYIIFGIIRFFKA